MSQPASLRESRRFCAWAGAWEPHPITPTSLIPSNALGRRGKRSRPPRTMVSDVSANETCSVLKTLDEKELLRVINASGRVERYFVYEHYVYKEQWVRSTDSMVMQG